MKVLTPREAAIFASLADAVAMPEPPLPPVRGTDAVEGFDAWLAAAPRENRAAVRASLLGLGTRLRGRDRSERVEAVRALEGTPGVALMMEALRAAAAAAYYGDEAVMRRLGYDAAERVRRGAEVRAARATDPATAPSDAESVVPSAAPPRGAVAAPRAAPSGATAAAGGVVDLSDLAGRRVVDADVVVVGSGAGGAVVAKELAEAGARVVIVEEGVAHDAAEFTARPRDMLPRLYRDAAQHATIGRPPILLPLGKAVGGTTLVNSGTCFRTPDRVLARWREEFGLDLDLAPHFERVERELNVVPVPPELAGANAHVARRGAEALGWSGGFVERNVRGCAGSGVCAYGCPTDAKQHVGVTYVPKAHRAGATTYTGVRVRKVRGVVQGTTAAGGRLEVRADRVIVAAGAIHTPALLARDRLGNHNLGRHLSLHPATAAFAVMPEVIDMARGVPQAYFIDEFAADGIMLEGIAGPPDYVAMGLPAAGEWHRELMEEYRHLAQFGLMISDDTRGRVRSLRGRPVVRYDLSDTDAARVRTGLRRLEELFRAAGATSVLLPSAHKLIAFHPLGSARMDARPGHGVLDAHQRVHGTENVYVCDGSAVPSSLGVNPQITIMTLATRLAHHLCRS